VEGEPALAAAGRFLGEADRDLKVGFATGNVIDLTAGIVIPVLLYVIAAGIHTVLDIQRPARDGAFIGVVEIDGCTVNIAVDRQPAFAPGRDGCRNRHGSKAERQNEQTEKYAPHSIILSSFPAMDIRLGLDKRGK
jgi:hypothetical protein